METERPIRYHSPTKRVFPGKVGFIRRNAANLIKWAMVLWEEKFFSKKMGPDLDPNK